MALSKIQILQRSASTELLTQRALDLAGPLLPPNPHDTRTEAPLNEILSVCVEAAELAGGLIRSLYGRCRGTEADLTPGECAEMCDLRVATKDNPDDFVTSADIASQVAIAGCIRQALGEIRIRGEEGDRRPRHTGPPASRTRVQSDTENGSFTVTSNEPWPVIDYSSIYILIDPLDSTASFVRGDVKEVTVLVAVVETLHGRPLAGVVHAPFIAGPATFYGAPGHGYCTPKLDLTLLSAPRRSLHLTAPCDLSHPPSAATSTPDTPETTTAGDDAPIHNELVSTEIILTNPRPLVIATSTCSNDRPCKRALQKLKPAIALRAPGAGNKFVLLLSGHADLYCWPRTGLCTWDCAAGQAVVEAAGGAVFAGDGSPLRYPYEGPVALSHGVVAGLDPALTREALAAMKMKGWQWGRWRKAKNEVV